MLKRWLPGIPGAALVVFLLTGCAAPEVAPEDVYRYQPEQEAEGDLSSEGLIQVSTKIKSNCGQWITAASELQELPGAKDLRIMSENGRSSFDAATDNSQVPAAIIYPPLNDGAKRATYLLSSVQRAPRLLEEPEEERVELFVRCQEREQVYSVAHPEEDIIYYPDAPGSQNIRILVSGAGHTEYGGLKFKESVTVDVWDDGTIEADSEGIVAVDGEGTEWVSRRVSLDNRTAVVMVREE